LTAKTPKPLLSVVKGKTLIEHVLDSLPKEIDEVIIVIKYLGEKIKKYVGSQYNGKKVTYVTGSNVGNAHSFLNLRKHLKDERFLLLYGDEIPNKVDVENCLKEDLSILTFEKNGTLTLDGVMVLNTNIFMCSIITTEFKDILNWFLLSYIVTRIKAKNFIGEINTPEDIKRVERIING
jgi:dTDP-glucose pyrophosphorylase